MNRFLGVLLVLTLLCSLSGCSLLQGEGKAKAAVFWYQKSDVHLKEVREQLNHKLKDLNLNYQNYFAEGNQSKQIDQIKSAMANGADLLLINQVTAGSLETAADIMTIAGSTPVIFFNRSIAPDQQADAEFFRTHENACFIGTDAAMSGHMQGQMIGRYVKDHYREMDLNRDGEISYAMFKGDNADVSSVFRTMYAVEDTNMILAQSGRKPLRYFDPDVSEDRQYQADPEGAWSAAAAEAYMRKNLLSCSESGGSMIELVIANNDDMAFGAVTALQEKGYNVKNGTYIPVFGIDASPVGRRMIEEGTMTGTILQDAEGVAEALSQTASAAADGMQPGEALGLLEDPRFSLSPESASRLYVAYSFYED